MNVKLSQAVKMFFGHSSFEMVYFEAMVVEARENWREEKLKIPREPFFKAIEGMREKKYAFRKATVN